MENKINIKREQIYNLEKRIEKDREKIKKLESDIEQIELTEIKATVKEIDIPLSEALKLLKELKSN